MDKFVKIPTEKLGDTDTDAFNSWLKEEVEKISDSDSLDSQTESEEKDFLLWLKHRVEQVIIDQTVDSVFKYGDHGVVYETVKLKIYAAKLNYGPYIGFAVTVDKPLPDRPNPHPFKLFDNSDITTTEDGWLRVGQIISHNNTMINLLKDLVLSDDELSVRYSDNHPLETRARIIFGLSLFWD